MNPGFESVHTQFGNRYIVCRYVHLIAELCYHRLRMCKLLSVVAALCSSARQTVCYYCIVVNRRNCNGVGDEAQRFSSCKPCRIYFKETIEKDFL